MGHVSRVRRGRARQARAQTELVDNALWVIPLSGLVTGLLLSIVVLAIDRASGYDLVSEPSRATQRLPRA
jgi:cobalamin synthase